MGLYECRGREESESLNPVLLDISWIIIIQKNRYAMDERRDKIAICDNNWIVRDNDCGVQFEYLIIGIIYWF